LRTGLIIALAVVATLAVIFLIMPFGAQFLLNFQEAQYFGEVNARNNPDVDQIRDKYGNICATSQYQSWNNVCNYDRPIKQNTRQAADELKNDSSFGGEKWKSLHFKIVHEAKNAKDCVTLTEGLQMTTQGLEDLERSDLRYNYASQVKSAYADGVIYFCGESQN